MEGTQDKLLSWFLYEIINLTVIRDIKVIKQWRGKIARGSSFGSVPQASSAPSLLSLPAAPHTSGSPSKADASGGYDYHLSLVIWVTSWNCDYIFQLTKQTVKNHRVWQRTKKPLLSLLLATCHNKTLGQIIKTVSKNVPVIVARVSVSLNIHMSISVRVSLVLYFKRNWFILL